MSDREAFEAHMHGRYGVSFDSVELHWKTWQASRAAALEETAKVCDDDAEEYVGGCENLALWSAAETIRALAQKDKP